MFVWTTTLPLFPNAPTSERPATRDNPPPQPPVRPTAERADTIAATDPRRACEDGVSFQSAT